MIVADIMSRYVYTISFLLVVWLVENTLLALR